MNEEIKNKTSTSVLNVKVASDMELHTRQIDENKSMEDMTEEEMIALVGNVPLFLDDDEPSDKIPPFICTTNIIELFGWKPGESLDEVIARKNGAKL